MKSIIIFVFIFLILIGSSEIILSAESYLLETSTELNWRDNTWKKRKLDTFMYNMGNNIDNLLSIKIEKAWVDDNWENSRKILYYYDSNDRLIEEMKLHYWKDFDYLFRYLYDYDNRGNLIESIYQESGGENHSKEITTYNQKNLKTEFVTQNWNDEQWRNNNKKSYEYLINDSLKEQNNFGWAKNLEDWTLLSKDVFSYFDKRTERLEKSKSGEEWRNVIFYVYKYDEDGKLIELSAMKWSNDLWINSYRIIIDYNEFGNDSIYQNQHWVEDNWINQYRILLNFDDNQNISENIYQNWVDNDWTNDYKYIFTHTLVTSVEETPGTSPNVDFMNYPNPFSNKTKISYYLPEPSHVSIHLYDLFGYEVDIIKQGLQQAGSRELIYNARKLQSGIFYCRIQTNKDYKIIKLILLK